MNMQDRDPWGPISMAIMLEASYQVTSEAILQDSKVYNPDNNLDRRLQWYNKAHYAVTLGAIARPAVSYVPWKHERNLWLVRDL